MFSKLNLLKAGRRFYVTSLAQNRCKAVMVDGNKIASDLLGVTLRDDIKKLAEAGVTPKLVAVVVIKFSFSTFNLLRNKRYHKIDHICLLFRWHLNTCLF